MAATYKGILTNNGKALIAGATINNKINYSHIAVGDGNGSVPTPLETRTALINEKARIALNVVEINPNNTNQIVCEAIIPTNIGGFYIRELGLYADNTMVVNASYPPTYKPLADEGGAREIAIKIVINIQNAEVIALYLDDSLIYATREWVNNNYIRRNEIVDNLTTDDAAKPLSSKQGKKLQDEKFAKTGGEITGNIKVPAVVTDKIWGDGDVSFASIDDKKARRIFAGGLLVSNAWADADKVPTNGSFVKGDITTNSNVNVGTRDGAKNSVWNSRINIAPPSHSGTWGVGVFDDTTNAMMGVRYSGVNVFYTDHLGNLNVTLSVTAPKFYGSLAGNADTASKLQISRNISFSGAATGFFNFDGSANASCLLTLANSGVDAGTYASTIQIPQITVNNKGLITSISQQNIRAATTTQTGVVQLVDDLTTDDSSKALTAKQAKNLQDNKLDKTATAISAKKLSLEATAFTTDQAFIQYFKDKSTAFFDNGSGKFFAQYSVGLVSSVSTGGTFIIASDVLTGKTKIISCVVRENGSIDYLTKKELAYTDSDISGNAATATQLKNARKINTINFDGTQNIDIEAPLRFLGVISSSAQLDSAVMDGKYTVTDLNVAGIYGYGFLVVLRSGGVCCQIYYPHLAQGTNNGTLAIRQSWNTNGNSATWSEWRVIGTRDDSKLPLAGGSLTGNLSAPSVTTDKIWGDGDVSFASIDDKKARRIFAGGLLVSNVWADADKVPTNGSFVKGDITTNSNVNVGTRDGAKNSEWNSRINIAPPSHNGTWGVGVFDDSANAMMGVRYSGENVFYTDHLGNLNVTSSVTAPKFRGTLEGNALSATKLQNWRNVIISGAVSGNAWFDGSGDINIQTTPNNTVRAYINFNMSTGAIRKSSGIASVTSLGSGVYRINLSQAAPDQNYVVVGMASWRGAAAAAVNMWDDANNLPSQWSFCINCSWGGDNTQGTYNPTYVNLAIMY